MKEFEFISNYLQGQIKKKKVVASKSFNYQIKLIAKIIFQRYANNNQMSLGQFSEWIKLHSNFTKTFDDCFRPNLWAVTQEQGEALVGYQKIAPDLQFGADLMLKNKFEKVQVKFIKFFMFFFHPQELHPFKIVIIKELRMQSFHEKLTIMIDLACKKYPKFTIKLSPGDFLKVEEYLRSYLSDNFFKKYIIVEKIGKGMYSDIFKVVQYRTGENYVLKVVEK